MAGFQEALLAGMRLLFATMLDECLARPGEPAARPTIRAGRASRSPCTGQALRDASRIYPV